VLLVVFMVTAPLLTTGLKIDLPTVNADSTPVADGRLLVTVTAEGKVIFDDQDVTGRAYNVFSTHERVQRERELYIRADKNALYGVVAEVVAAARRSGVDSLNLLVQPDEGADEQAAVPGAGQNASPK
jgi:biopolymer transport protein TolR